jgi:hypothetical protein
MGAILGVRISTGSDVPFWFTRTDSKNFLYHLLSTKNVDKIARYFALDITRLHAIAEREEETLESFLSRDPTEARRQYWMKIHEQNEAAWQAPRNLMTLLARLLEALNTNPNVYTHLQLTDDYFIQGFFQQDIQDLYRMMQWAEQEQIEQVRLEVG